MANTDDQERIGCPYCSEQILKSAKKCRFCGEWLVKTKKSSRVGKSVFLVVDRITSFSLLVWVICIFIFLATQVLTNRNATIPNEAESLSVIVGIISFAIGITGAIINSFLREKPSKSWADKFSRFLNRLLLGFVISVVLGLVSLPLLITASGYEINQMTEIGNVNMWRFVTFYGLFVFVLALISFRKKKLRLLTLVMFLYLVCGVGFVSAINLSDSGKLNFKINKPEYVKEIYSENVSTCNEQEALANAKSCTFYIARDDGGHGSGFLISDGYLVTNRHVIEGATRISTQFNNNNIDLTLWGYSDEGDIAVLKGDIHGTTCAWQPKNNIALGETLYAVGWPYVLEGESTVTKGIYSRFVDTEEGASFIQTDAAINPGNSGGPLVGKCGVVGINEFILRWADSETPLEGFGFAIAADYAKPIVEDILKNGHAFKLPIEVLTQTEYTQNDNQEVNPPNSQQTYNSYDISGWQKARNTSNEMKTYWHSIDSSGYDSSKLNQIKDLTIRMATTLDNIIPKMSAGQTLSTEENRLLGEWNNMYNQAFTLEGELDGHSYANGYYHYECQYQSCSNISGRGKNKCSSYTDCTPKYHYECKDRACQQVEGEGESSCYISSDCYHNECQDGKCVEVDGKGINACYTDYGCN